MNRLSVLSILFFIGSALIYAVLEWQAVDISTEQAQTEEVLPDFIAESLKSKTYSEQGHVRYKIDADRMEHYSNLAITHFEMPTYTIYPENDETWIISAQEGTLYNNSRVKLVQNVRISSTNENALISEVQGKHLEIDLTNNIISSEQSILIQGKDFTMQGAGLIIDLNSNKMTLAKHVRTTYEKHSN